jgi:hypothetical protein
MHPAEGAERDARRHGHAGTEGRNGSLVFTPTKINRFHHGRLLALRVVLNGRGLEGICKREQDRR